MKLIALVCLLMLPTALCFAQWDNSSESNITVNLGAAGNFTLSDGNGNVMTIEVKPAAEQTAAIESCRKAVAVALPAVTNARAACGGSNATPLLNAQTSLQETKAALDALDALP